MFVFLQNVVTDWSTQINMFVWRVHFFSITYNNLSVTWKIIGIPVPQDINILTYKRAENLFAQFIFTFCFAGVSVSQMPERAFLITYNKH